MLNIEGLVALGLLLVTAGVAGWLAGQLTIPPLVGMLLAGLALRNVPGDLLGDLPSSWSVALRLFALTIILIRAGLGLNLVALRRLQREILRLAFLPNMAETVTVAGVAVLLLQMPVSWALLLGFVVAAVSPAVVVPGLLDLQSRGFGVDKGIPTMVLAAASLDDILSITGFGLIISLIFGGQAESGVVASLVRAPLELALGLGIGVVAGRLAQAVPLRRVRLRGMVLIGLGLVSVAGGWVLGFTGGGSLAAMTMGAVAARSWKSATAPVAEATGAIWTYAQVALFGLIGAAVSLTVVESTYVVRGLVILVVGLVIRVAVGYASLGGSVFIERERLFVALAWIPKATVQAAIGALALDLARRQDAGVDAIAYGTQVVTVAVLAIIVTAPVGAFAIARTGPIWLRASSSDSTS